MKRRNMFLGSALGVVALAALALSLSGSSPVTLAGLVLNTFRAANSPPGTLVVELREAPTMTAVGTTVAADTSWRAHSDRFDAGSWPSYNRTITSQRYSPLSQINTQTVHRLKVLCSYDTQLHENFNPGLLMVDGALIGTTAHDIFSIDPSNCRENWRAHRTSKQTCSWSIVARRT
jgi:alcohol dehydrogenase (cytochrome c)